MKGYEVGNIVKLPTESFILKSKYLKEHTGHSFQISTSHGPLFIGGKMLEDLGTEVIIEEVIGKEFIIYRGKSDDWVFPTVLLKSTWQINYKSK